MTATPPRADLRTLATHAAHDVDCPDGPNCGDELTTDGRYGRYADAVLAAVLPEHRRMVLGEAAEALQHRADNVPWSDPDIKRGVQYAHSVVVMLARESAAAAPPAGLSATVPAETAPPVPEKADGQRAGQGDDYPGTPEERARYWKQRAETAWELGDEHCLKIIRLRRERDRLAAQVDQCQRVVEAAKAWRAARPGPWVSGTDVEFHLFAAVDALPDVEPHQHECACNRNWGGPCGPCVCEEPPRQGVWRLICGAENIPPNQTYATKGAAEDVMRLHDGACPGTHGVEFVPDAGTDQTEDEIDVHL